MRSVIEYTRLNEFLIIVLAYTVGYLVVDFIVAPVQYLYLSRDFTVGSLLFIPHGIRVLAVWLCGSRAILPLIIAELFCTVMLWQPDVALSTSLGSSMVGGLCVYLTFELFRLAGIEMRPDGKDSALTNWRSLILLASIASVFNSVGKQIFFGSLAPLADEVLILGIFWIGDTLGTFACLLLLIGIRRRFQF
ncbi:MAG: hypothetical protein P8N75_02805 [Ascidiaceihabitans sp.]|nr:hypothetical protein [Ascidiaceihabitans sp.]